MDTATRSGVNQDDHSHESRFTQMEYQYARAQREINALRIEIQRKTDEAANAMARMKEEMEVRGNAVNERDELSAENSRLKKLVDTLTAENDLLQSDLEREVSQHKQTEAAASEAFLVASHLKEEALHYQKSYEKGHKKMLRAVSAAQTADDARRRIEEEQRSLDGLRLQLQRQLVEERQGKEELQKLVAHMRDVAAAREKDVEQLQMLVQEFRKSQEALLLEKRELENKAAERDSKLAHRFAESASDLRRMAESASSSSPTFPRRNERGDLFSKCLRCGELFNLAQNTIFACGYHPEPKNVSGRHPCCGVRTLSGQPAVNCQFGPHVA